MKNRKLVTIVTAVCLLMVFSAALSGCKQATPTPAPPVNGYEDHYLVYLGGDRVLDYTAWGNYRIWVYDRNIRGDGKDPMTHEEVSGQWGSIDFGDKLIYLGGDRVLDWKWRTGEYRIWVYDRTVRGKADPFPGDPEVYGTWSSIGGAREERDISLTYLGNDRLLEWHDNDGKWWTWVYDRSVRGKADPIRTREAYGQWDTITDDGNHWLWYIGDDTTNRQVLEVDQHSDFWVWNYDTSLRGQTDVLTPRLDKGQWGLFKSYGITFKYEYIYLGNNRLLVWENNGWHGTYVINRSASNGQDIIPGDAEVSGKWSSITCTPK